MVRRYAVGLEVPTYLENLVQYALQGISQLHIGYDVDVVEDAHRLWAQVQGTVKLHPLLASSCRGSRRTGLANK